ncbi:hypothetical protein LCGC14_1157640 [marine sediment metagenome]|uniref:Uncharacterized protein n=1 Tax=marine sediment metagenome TaxID=412755 RepID=A0A0F9LYL5_9ZZZZ
MDVYCKRCGEPYDLYHVQQDMEATERRRFWDGEGCSSCYGKPVERTPFRAQVTAALHDLMGGDVDGLAASLEDAEGMFGGEFWE